MSLLPRLLIAVAILTISAVRADAQTAVPQETPAQPRTIAGPATAVTVDGFIHEVVAEHASGRAQGTHLMVDSLTKTVDVNAGPWLSPEMKAQMIAGASVHVTGLSQAVNGKEYVLAQQITVNGQTFTIRNANGIPARTHMVSRNGGAR